jgi:hypothetical protein
MVKISSRHASANPTFERIERLASDAARQSHPL